MATVEEQEKLIEVLKFTPRTYKIRLWGYGGEYVMGTVDRRVYDYFRRRRLDLSEFAWDSDYADANNIPEDMWPFYPGQWHDCEDMGHCWGVDRSAGTLQVEDEHGNVVFEKRLEDISGFGEDDENPEPEWLGGDEIWIDSKPAGTVVFVATSSEKGTFFEGDIELKTPFNPGRIALTYDEIDGNEVITGVEYQGVEIDNFGGDTTGKGSDFGMYIAGSNKQDGNGYERYRNMDDIDYTLTDWFPVKVNPVREGVYNIKLGKEGYTHQARWNGSDWRYTWSSEDDEPLKIKQWQGIAYDPDEQDLRDELDKIILKVPVSPTAEQIDQLEAVNCIKCGWVGKADEAIFKPWPGGLTCPVCKEDVEFSK
jgi:predicted Zn-ribbon and HTH transcriptional regulator